MKKSFGDLYKNGILDAYDAARDGLHSDFLIDPTPAHLRNLCQLLWEDGLDKNDEQIFMKFFGYVTIEEGLQHIKDIDLDKLRPVQRFFLRQSNLSKPEAINLAAVLVNRENRPYAKFIKAGMGPGTRDTNILLDKGISGDTKIAGNISVDDIHPVAGMHSRTEDHNIHSPHQQDLIKIDQRGNQPKNDLVSKPLLPARKPVVKWAAYAVIIAVIVLGVWKLAEPKCMAWKEYHFEIVSCDDESSEKVIPYEKVLLTRMRKITPTDTTTYFKNGKPIVWYSKQDNTIEFFSYYGEHPVTGTTLKAVTRHILEKHVLNKQ